MIRPDFITFFLHWLLSSCSPWAFFLLETEVNVGFSKNGINPSHTNVSRLLSAKNTVPLDNRNHLEPKSP